MIVLELDGNRGKKGNSKKKSSCPQYLPHTYGNEGLNEKPERPDIRDRNNINCRFNRVGRIFYAWKAIMEVNISNLFFNSRHYKNNSINCYKI
jgi:hypothetical protein